MLATRPKDFMFGAHRSVREKGPLKGGYQQLKRARTLLGGFLVVNWPGAKRAKKQNENSADGFTAQGP